MTQNIYQLPLNFEQILALIRQLSETEKRQIVQELETEYRTSKLDCFLNEFQTDELSLEEITEEVELVRSQNYRKKSYVDSDR